MTHISEIAINNTCTCACNCYQVLYTEFTDENTVIILIFEDDVVCVNIHFEMTISGDRRNISTAQGSKMCFVFNDYRIVYSLYL